MPKRKQHDKRACQVWRAVFLSPSGKRRLVLYQNCIDRPDAERQFEACRRFFGLAEVLEFRPAGNDGRRLEPGEESLTASPEWRDHDDCDIEPLSS